MSTDEETRLAALMDDSASRMPVGEAPAAQVFADGRRGRRRRSRAVAAGSVAVVLAVVGTLGAVTGQFRGADVGPAGLPTPEGKWIGMGHVFLDVGTDWGEGHVCDPDRAAANLYDVSSWGSVDVVCGEYEPTGTLVGFSPLDEGTDTATLSQQLERRYGSVRPETVDGHEVLRSGVRCTEVGEANSGNGFTPATERKCFAGIDVPGQGVTLNVWSHEDAPTIDALLDTLRIEPDAMAVPAPRGMSTGSLLDEYVDELADSGFTVRTQGAEMGPDATLDDVSPAVGTAAAVGSEVTLTLVPDPTVPGKDGQWVGLGHVAVNLPDDWTGEGPCFSGPDNTWSVYSEAVYQETWHMYECLFAPWDDAEGMRVILRPDRGSGTDESGVAVTVDDHQALLTPTECGVVADTEQVRCGSELRFPGEVLVSVNGEDEAAVDAILERVRWFDDYVGVPSMQHEPIDYARDQLELYGFEVTTSGNVPARECPQVAQIDPAPGTLVPLGSSVHVVVEPMPEYESRCSYYPDN